ncbi:putative glycerophosphoryl diester phosphodiesterase 1 [Rosistilla carotiformis]|uniref:Putative glycerophosphoryl diester phosphodiesterase 1 n=1 Tax=Rosistilla carotiformis TaxID=2528017 RepID=A0A518K0A2_9BACT|nr:glycerophosphodiester phosphodiesterase [Rosistilla carotiformis]QDV71145.1 putative glycerophosphoryl diester phosphodiesterase 1 [Rosistilla carotiformis]
MLNARWLLTVVLFCGCLDSTVWGQVIVGHRGASFDAPENTVAAFEEAWRQQADGVEGDFYLTTDGQIVCIHDKDTARTGGRRLKVSGSSLEQLRQLEYGSWKDARFAGEPLPTFADVWRAIPEGKLFVVELKVGPEIVRPLKQQLEELKVPLEQVLIIAFNTETVALCKELLPTVRVHWLTGYKKDAKSGQWRPSLEQVAQSMRDCKADGLGTQGNRQVVTPEFIEQLKRRGMAEFHVWTIDSPDDARYFQKLGAVGITTNRPALIRESLATGKPSPL